MAPKDTYKIWKVGSNVRFDFSLVGFEGIRSKRREMSILFRDGSKIGSRDLMKDSWLVMLNKSREIMLDPLEELDEEEKLAVLTDILNADAYSNDLRVEDPTYTKSSTFFGYDKTSNIGDFNCTEYKVQFTRIQEKEKKLSSHFNHKFESYFNNS